MSSIKFSQDVEQVEKMEADLVSKISLAITSASLDMTVHGVFSLDDLETKLESDLGSRVGVGVSYAGSTPAGANTTSPTSVDRSQSVKTLIFTFLIVLAVPTEECCGKRHNATKLLSVLRMAILGSPIVTTDRVQRTWNFVRERPEISDSTKTMLYYSQVWQVAMQNLGAPAV